MILLELEQRDFETPYYNSDEDKYGTRQLSNSRKKRLFLSDINKLKRIRAVQELERARREDLISVMYGAPADEGGAPGGGIGF